MKSIPYPLVLLFIFWVTALGAQRRAESIEHLLLFYPEYGERELLLYMQQNKDLGKTEAHQLTYLKGC